MNKLSIKGRIHTVEETEEDPMKLKLTYKGHSVIVTKVGLLRWYGKGEYIQDAMPELSADDREFLISGITPNEFHRLFGNEEK